MGLPPWVSSESQFFALITGANSGLGHGVAGRIIEDFLTSPSTPSTKHLVLIVCTRSPLKTRFTISRLRAHLRRIVDETPWAKQQKKAAAAEGREFKWQDWAQRVHFLGVEVDLCDLQSVYAVADRLVNGTVGSPDATTAEGLRLPAGSPGTAGYTKDGPQDPWALSDKPGSSGVARAWGWGLSGIRIPRLDAVIFCAGIGGWKEGFAGINWPVAVKDVLTHPIEATTWPIYKISHIGATIKQQLKEGKEETQPLLDGQDTGKEEPKLGKVFCANTFGHYILGHQLTPLLSRPATPTSKVGGKIIFTSSLEPLAHHFNADDLQGLEVQDPYESAKRVIDLLALTSELPSVKPLSESYFNPSKIPVKKIEGEEDLKKLPIVKPSVHVVHPGIFVSDIIPFPAFIVAIYTIVFYFVRWIGSPWHPITAEKAATAPVWVALHDPEELNELEGRGLAKKKWGSATDASGNERVKRTEVPGWGWDGKVGSTSDEGQLGRKRDAVDLDDETREEFEVLGGRVWKELEELRLEWEDVLGIKKN